MDPVSLTMTTVGLVLVIFFISLAIYDLVLVTFFGKSSTVSQFLISAGFQSPTIVGGFMYVAGHLFSTMYPFSCTVDWTTRSLDIGCGILFGAGCFALIQALVKRFSGG